jgi:hypothetical protein
MLPKKCVTQLDRAKNHFLLMASVLILILAAVVSLLLQDLQWAAEHMEHQSMLFNPFIPVEDSWAGIGMCFLFSSLFIFCICFGMWTSDFSFKDCCGIFKGRTDVHHQDAAEMSHPKTVTSILGTLVADKPVPQMSRAPVHLSMPPSTVWTLDLDPQLRVSSSDKRNEHLPAVGW